MQGLKEIFELVKKRNFIEKYTAIHPGNGIQNRISGRGSNDRDKRVQCTEEEMKLIKAGLKSFIEDLQKAEAKL